MDGTCGFERGVGTLYGHVRGPRFWGIFPRAVVCGGVARELEGGGGFVQPCFVEATLLYLIGRFRIVDFFRGVKTHGGGCSLV